MPSVGWCSECGDYVWLTEDGACANGHAASRVGKLPDGSSGPPSVPEDAGLAAPSQLIEAAPPAGPVGAEPAKPKRKGCLVALALAAFFIVGTFLIMLTSCRHGPATYPRTLSNGSTIQVVSVGKLNFSQSGPGLVLRYHTDTSLEDSQALSQEVDGIWQDFRADAESADVTGAAIVAQGESQGWPLYHSKSFGFVYHKLPDGSWTRDESK